MIDRHSGSVACGRDVRHAVRLLRDGGVVGLPTETVYGLGADASNPDAVARVFAVKGRPADHPLIVHLSSRRRARAWSAQWPPVAEALARRFWPGPLTLVVRRASHVIDEVTGGRDTVALRVPAHGLMRRVLRLFGGGIAAPSANRFGEVSPTRAEHVVHDLGGDVDYVLDGGPCSLGVESTIVDCTVEPPQILRPGGITEEMVMEVVKSIAPVSGSSRAPGMLESHYAPMCRVVAVETLDEARELVKETVGLTNRVLDASIDPRGFARSMYSDLRRCDDDGIEVAIVVLPSSAGIGAAVRDRVAKAAAAR